MAPNGAPMIGATQHGIQHETASDGLGLSYRRIRAERARASLVYLHGIQSHGGWYVETADALAAHGYSVYLPDRRGSGLSAGPRGYFPSREQLVDDVRVFVERARQDEPDLPVFVVGGCWGARPATGYALQRADEIAGLVLVCPALNAQVDLRASEKLKVVAGGVASPQTPVRIPLEPELFTTNQPYLEFIRADPLALRHVTASFFLRQFFWDRRLLRDRGLALPVLVLQSGRDRIVDVPAVRAWYERLASADRRYVFYPDFEHLLDFERERQRYWADLLAWLDGHTP